MKDLSAGDLYALVCRYVESQESGTLAMGEMWNIFDNIIVISENLAKGFTGNQNTKSPGLYPTAISSNNII